MPELGLSPEQRAIRRGGIGGSEIAGVAGLSPYATPWDVYLAKTEDTEKDVTHHMERGRFFGPAIVAWYQHRYCGEAYVSRVGKYEETMVHPAHPIVVATPDGIRHTAGPRSKWERVVEAKCPHWRSAHLWGEPGTDDVPRWVICQNLWEMAVAQVELADVVATLNDDICLYTVAWNEDLFHALRERAEQFWRDHVVPRKPPEIDERASDRAREWLAKNHPRATLELLEATAEQIEKLHHWSQVYDEARTDKKHAESAQEWAGNHLRRLLGDAEAFADDLCKVTWKNNKDSKVLDQGSLVAELAMRAGVDEAELKRLMKQFTTTTPGDRVLRVVMAKEE